MNAINVVHFTRAMVVALFVAVLPAITSVPHACAATGDVTVNCASTLSETGGNDMATLRSYFRGASQPPGYGVPQPHGSQIGLTHMRLINTGGGTYYDSERGEFIPGLRNASGNYAVFSLAYNLNSLQGMIPHIIVGQNKPQNLTGTPLDWTEAQWDQYETYCFNFVKYVLTDYNGGSFNQAIFEVGNEWEISDEVAWVLGYVPPVFHDDRYAAYVKIYQRWQAAIKNYKIAYPSKSAQIWGPNAATEKWVTNFISASATNNWLLDAYTIHMYGNSTTVGNGSYGNQRLTDWVNQIYTQLSSVGRSSTPVNISEWGPSWLTTDVAWVEDGLPAGTTPYWDGGDSWNWVTDSPAPYSGTQAHQSIDIAGEHQHYFTGANPTLAVNNGDRLFAYVYLDPLAPPSQVMLQWNDGTWEHRAYWGTNSIPWGTDGTVSRRYMGALPATGQWVRLEVPASMVGLEGHNLNGMAFTLFNGRATWDRAGKSGTSPNYNHIGAAWTAAFLRDSLKSKVGAGSYLIMSDVPAWGFREEWASFVYRDAAYVPFAKPAFNTMRMANMMAGLRRVSTTASVQPNIGALASTNETSFFVLAYNYNTDPNILVDNTVPETVVVKLTNMPFSSGKVRVQRYLIDANTSNLAKKLEAGLPPDSTVELQLVQDFTQNVSKKRLTLSSITLDKSAVSLWVITKQ